MKKVRILISTLLTALVLSGCGGKGGDTTSSTPSHTHDYDTDNITWSWSKSSLGFAATATLNCKTCASGIEGHTVVLDGEISSYIEKEPTCTESGIKKYKADIVVNEKTYSNVNQESITVRALGHQMEYTHDEEKHYYLCTREGCGYVESSADHDYSDWEIVKEPDFGEEGLKKHHCKDEHCGYEEEEIIPGKIPSVTEVQTAVDKALETLCPLTGHRINHAKKMYSLLSEEDKKLVKDYDKLDKQEEQYSLTYGIVSTLNTSELQFTEGWETTVSLESLEDKEQGQILKVNGVSKGGVAEFKFVKLDTSDCTSVSFYVYSETATKFTLSKQDWWREAYDFSDSTWKEDGGKVNFNLSSGWNELSLPIADFDEASYFSAYFPAGQFELKITPFYGKSFKGEIKNVIDLIDSIKNDGSKSDAYTIYLAEQKYNALPEKAKPFVTNYDDLVSAKQNAAYGIASALNTTELQFTEGWNTSASLTSVEDESKGHVIKINGESIDIGGASEFKFLKLDTADYVSISFSVYSTTATTFALSKQDWWREAYDFKTSTWKDNGQNVSFTLSAGWNDLSLSVDDFNETSYFSAYIPVGLYELKITPFYGKKVPQSEIQNVINLIDKIPADVSSLQMKDTYDIAVAKKAFDLLPSGGKAKVTNAQHLTDAIANCQYSMASFCDSSSFVMTPGWDADATVSSKIDPQKGHVSSMVLTVDNDGALEYKFEKENLTKGDATVYFSVYTTHQSKFTLSKQDWWREAYDFSDKSWKEHGGYVSFVLSEGWNDLTISLNNFMEINYFSFSLDGPVLGDELMISAFYVK